MPAPDLHGIVPAVVTPFREDESIDYTAWQRILEFLIGAGVHGLFIAGGQGEFFALTEEERTVVVRFAVQTVAGRVPVYVNIGAVTTAESSRLAQQAEAEGADVLVAITPYYIRPSPEELLDHYVEICRSVRLPVMAYNIPERTGVELAPSILRQVKQDQSNFKGLKDSSGNLDLIPQWLEAGLVTFMGRDHLVLAGLERGCAGAVSACANVAPRAFVELFRAWQAGDREKAARIQALIEPLRRAFALGTFPAVVKEAMTMAGIPAGRCRRPVGPLPEAARAQLAPILQALTNEGLLTPTA
jgi:4-hydroxy-tetrahydrodipicolinate synthase